MPQVNDRWARPHCENAKPARGRSSPNQHRAVSGDEEGFSAAADQARRRQQHVCARQQTTAFYRRAGFMSPYNPDSDRLVSPAGGDSGRNRPDRLRSLADRNAHGVSNLLARASSNRAAQHRLPPFGRQRRGFEPEGREHGEVIDVRGDLFGSAPRGDVLGAGELVTAAVASHAQQVVGHNWNCPAGTFLPRRASG